MKYLNILGRENKNFWRKWFWVIVFAVSFFSAGFIRLININSHVLYFRPYRQCDSLIKARDFYFKNNNKIDQWRKDIAKAQMANISTKEPPVTEYLVSRFYKLIGRESPWVPKAVCSFFWLTAGIFVFFTIRLFGNVYHGLVGLLSQKNHIKFSIIKSFRFTRNFLYLYLPHFRNSDWCIHLSL